MSHDQDPGTTYFVETDKKRSFPIEVERVVHSKLPSGRAASEVAVVTELSAKDNAGFPPHPSKPVIFQPTFQPWPEMITV